MCLIFEWLNDGVSQLVTHNRFSSAQTHCLYRSYFSVCVSTSKFSVSIDFIISISLLSILSFSIDLSLCQYWLSLWILFFFTSLRQSSLSLYFLSLDISTILNLHKSFSYLIRFRSVILFFLSFNIFSALDFSSSSRVTYTFF